MTGVDSFSWGSVTFDPALPVTDADATINTTAIAYTRALSIAGRSANVGIQLPIVAGHVEGMYLGTFTEVDRFGQGGSPVSGSPSTCTALLRWRRKRSPRIGSRPSWG